MMRKREVKVCRAEMKKTKRNNRVSCRTVLSTILSWLTITTINVESTANENYLMMTADNRLSMKNVVEVLPEVTTNPLNGEEDEELTTDISEYKFTVYTYKGSTKFGDLKRFENPLIKNNSKKDKNVLESTEACITTEEPNESYGMEDTYVETTFESSIETTIEECYVTDDSYTTDDIYVETTIPEETTYIETTTVYDGPVLTKAKGTIMGPSGKETYYNLNMSQVVKAMRNMGYDESEYPYWIREDGVKMLGDYVMVAANLKIRPKGTILPCSLGEAIVVDTGGFARRNPNQLDIAVNW